MADDSTFGGGLTFPGGDNASLSGADFGGGPADATAPGTGADVPSAPGARAPAGLFGSGFGASYTPPDPMSSALDQTAAVLTQRVNRANQIAANPVLQFFNPEGVQKARDFVPAATEKLQQIRVQQAGIKAGKQQAETLGLAPGEVPDEATQADRVEAARSRALKGDLRVFKGLQAVDPKAAEAIQDQVHEVTAGHLSKAQFAFDKLSNMRNQGEYTAAVQSLRKDGTLSDLEALGLKVPATFDAFGAVKAKEGQALREARIGVDTVRQRLEERNTYQPMEEKEAKTYNGRITTVFGDQITNGTWARNAAAGTRGLVVNGAADPRDLGKSFTLASPEQRKAISEEANGAVPKAELEKARAFDRTYELAKPTAEQIKRGDAINTNPNVQQAIAEQLASMLRGGTGGANVGLLNIETSKRGLVQGLLDKVVAGYAGGINTISGKDVRGYMTKLTQGQIREVIDGIKAHNDELLNDRVAPIAKRAGALGLDTTAFGWGKDEAAGVIGDAIRAGRDEQIARMLPNHQAIGGGDGVFQLGAQRPGVNAVQPPQGVPAATTQLPGAPALTTPVQQATGQPVPPAPQPAPAAQAPQQGTRPGPVTIAGQPVNVTLPPGASSAYTQSVQRIESGRERDPWKAGTEKTSASGAFQFTKATWNEDKPAGAPDRAADATPQQQAEAFATRTAKNAAALTKKGLPVDDISLYVSHNLGVAGGPRLLAADPKADARSIVGEEAARNNPLFFRGKPTVATVLERYRTEMEKGALPPDSDGPKPKPGSGGATAVPGRWSGIISRALMQGVPEDQRDKAAADVGNAAVEHAPAIGSVAGAVAGSAAGPAGTIAGGAAGGGAGQSLKDYLQGREQSPADIAKEAALGAVFGIMPAGRPIAGAVARAGGAGAVEAGAAAAKGEDSADVAEAGMKGAGLAAGGELFGRSLGMIGHKVWNMFAPDAKKAVQSAAAKFSDAEEVLAKEAPKLPSVNGAAGGPNPKYLKAEAERVEAERVLKDAGLKPEEAAYAHKVSTEGVPRQEAEVARPGEIEKQRVGAGYQQLETEVAQRGVGEVKPTPKLPDGPRAAVENKQVSAKHAELAERVEAAITAPAPNWQAKWVQLKEARTQLLEAERDALTSTAPGRSKIAQDMRALADSVRTQQEKAAKYVFGERDGAEFMTRLKVLDTRYRNLMEATNGGDLAKAAAMKGEAGREAEKKFMAFAHDDPTAQAAYRAMRKGGSNVENDVRTLVGMERVPYIGHVVTWAKMAGRMREWAQERAAGSPVTFAEMVKMPGFFDSNKPVRDLLGAAAQRGAAM